MCVRHFLENNLCVVFFTFFNNRACTVWGGRFVWELPRYEETTLRYSIEFRAPSQSELIAELRRREKGASHQWASNAGPSSALAALQALPHKQGPSSPPAHQGEQAIQSSSQLAGFAAKPLPVDLAAARQSAYAFFSSSSSQECWNVESINF